MLFGADVSNLREADSGEDPSGDKYEEQLLHKLDQLREDMGKHLKQSTPQQGGIGEAGEHYDVTEEIEKLMTGGKNKDNHCLCAVRYLNFQSLCLFPVQTLTEDKPLALTLKAIV